MCHIIDRRLNGRNKSAVNRQRFIRRYKAQLKKAVADAISERGITEDGGEQVGIPARDISEPTFQHGKGGRRETVHPGNHDFITGDRVERPPSGQGGGGSEASDQGEGEDSFTFRLSRDEFLDLIFDDLELPRMAKSAAAQIVTMRSVRAGYSQDGNPSSLAVVRSLRGAIGRRIAMGAGIRRELHEAEAERDALLGQGDLDSPRLIELHEHIAELERRIAGIPFLDTFDLRYHNRTAEPKPKTQAVMFCLMDVSASMDEQRKDIAKRFFMLLYFFLNRTYEHIHVVFIRHHTTAKEVDEQEFFQALETGGTVVSTALKLMDEVIAARYPVEDWNIYAAQASDGDNWGSDTGICRSLLEESILSKVQYFAYVQVGAESEQALWKGYESLLADNPHLAMRKILGRAEVYPVFRDLMRKQDHERSRHLHVV